MAVVVGAVAVAVVARRCVTTVAAAVRCIATTEAECIITVTDIGAEVFGYSTTTVITTDRAAGGAMVIGIAVITEA